MTMSDKKNHKRLTFSLLCGVFFMFGFCYLLVPLYQLICKTEGINGRTAMSKALPVSGDVDYSRTIKVDFVTELHGGLHFTFLPLKRHIEIHPGETKLIYFYAENKVGHDITVQAVPSITPMDAARFLKKTECFCFTQQYFFNHEKADMPVYFYIDRHVPEAIKEITLAYTLFDATPFLKQQKRATHGRIDV